MWTHRIMLEAALRSDNAFVTITYEDTHLPLTPEGRSSLRAKDVQDWLKRLRFRISPLRIRYFLVGEYGDETFRPHYHAALFGFPTCRRGRTLRRPGSGIPQWKSCCDQCRLVGDTWEKGNVDLGKLETSSAQYISGYVTKKIEAGDNWIGMLEGRAPEFCRMSLRPGIGLDAMHDVASTLMQFNLENSQADVPSSLRHGSRSLPLGRYLRGKLRTMVGRDAKAPQATFDKIQADLQPLLQASFKDPEAPSLKSQIVKAKAQDVVNMQSRQRLFKRRKML